MQFVKIHSSDNVAVALEALSEGAVFGEITLTEDIPAGHKFALCDIAAGENIIKYGAPIGHAASAISSGAWVHTHNTKTNLSDVIDYTYDPIHSDIAAQPPKTFRGFRRANGNVGIRNEIWIIPTVGCVNSPAEALAKEAAAFVHGSVDGVYLHLDEIKKPALHRNLEENEDQARMSLFLVTIKTDCDVELDTEGVSFASEVVLSAEV